MNRIPDIDRLDVRFDEGSLVADAGLLVAASLLSRLGLERLVDDTVRMDGRPGGARPGRKVLSLVASMLCGGTHIDHADRLRSGSTRRVLPFRVMAPSTLGTFLRSFTWGHVCQLNKALGVLLKRVWSLPGAGPGDRPLVIDVDSTICEVSGKSKEGACYGHTQVLGYHPLIAARADTGEIVHHRLRKGSSQKGNTRFMVETVNRVRRAGATGPITIRADKGFWSRKTVRKLEGMGVEWFIAIPRYPNVKQAIGHLDDTDWVDIGYTPDGEAQVAETMIVTKIDKTEHTVRLIIRRTRLADAEQQPLWKDWRHHTFATNSDLPATEADRTYRNHARVELGIRDLKHHTGLAHCPSGQFFANAAWMAAAVIAHNLYRWINHHTGQGSPQQLTNGNTVRNRLFKLPGRIVNHAGQLILRLPARWPWATTYHTTLTGIRNLPQLC